MSDKTYYLVTGGNKGIGRAMVQQLLQRPRTIVVATVRYPDDPTSASLYGLPVAESSRLFVQPLRVQTDFDILPGRLRDLSIPYLDVVISNAGGSRGLDKSLLETDTMDILEDCKINAAYPLQLFQVLWPLLEAAIDFRRNGPPGLVSSTRFILISSTMGSITAQEVETMPVGVSYGMSKAAANWFVKKASIDFKNKGLVVGALHPGWVRTAMGQAIADALGMKEPPITADESAAKCLEQIDGWRMEKTGKFFTHSGEELPW